MRALGGHMKKNVLLGINLCSYAFGVLLAMSQLGYSQEPLTVCQVLKDLDAYSGKIIQVRGIWRGAFLEEECPKALQTEGYTWINRILLFNTGNSANREKPVDWVFGHMESWPAFKELLRYKGNVYATITGRLDARAKLSPSPNGGPPVPFGYGHLGVYPARIVMKAIENIVGSELKGSDEMNEIIYTTDGLP
jgi:hypothetical protein